MHRLGVMGPVAQELWAYPKLLNVIEQIVGPEVVGHPVWNIRICLPKYGETLVPWHQVQTTKL